MGEPQNLAEALIKLRKARIKLVVTVAEKLKLDKFIDWIEIVLTKRRN